MQSGVGRTRERRTFVLAATGVGIVVGLFTIWLAAGFGGKTLCNQADDLGSAVAAGFPAVGCALAARRESNRERRWGWLAMAASCLSWAIGELVYSWYDLVAAGAPFPSVADALFLLACPLATVSLLLFVHTAVSGATRMRALVEGLMVGSALLFASELLLAPVYQQGADSQWERLILMAYPISDVISCSIVIFALARTNAARSIHLGLIGGGLVAMAISDSSFALLQVKGTYGSLNWLDNGWNLGFGLIWLASLRGATARRGEGPSQARIPSAILPFTVIPITVVTGSVSWLLDRTRFNDFVVLDTAVFIFLLVAHQITTLIENHKLQAHLEDVVKARTLQLEQSADLHAHRATHDGLTGLPNRQAFQERLERRTVGAPAASDVMLAVLMLDLDDFKRVNDSMGHAYGDLLLVEVAHRIAAELRPEDLVARLGGDEYAVLLEGREDWTAVTATMDRLLAAIAQPIKLGTREVVVTASIGATTNLERHDLANDLLRDADVAMYVAKGEGKARHARFDPSLQVQLTQRLELANDLRHALCRDELVLNYQPLVNLDTAAIVGVEALIRWEHPTRGLIMPNDFIPIAEETGLIVDIGRWVLEQSCQHARQWRDVSGDDMTICVNLSPRQLRSPTLIADVQRALSVARLPANALELELTESMLVTDPDRAEAVLHQLKATGVSLAIDDFGTGHSSMSYLVRYPFDTLKIDRSFVKDIPTSREQISVARAIVQLADALDMNTIAEGIETDAERLVMLDVGCVHGQGFFFARPMSAELISNLVTKTPSFAALVG